MARLTAFLFLQLCWPLLSFSQGVLCGETRFQLASVEVGRDILTSSDEYVVRTSTFDRAALMRTTHEVSREEYLEFVGECVIDWTEDEASRIERAVHAVCQGLTRFEFELPKTVHMIRTEGGGQPGPYTRDHAIVLPTSFMESVPDHLLEKIIAHEIFHIVTRSNPEMRERLYAAIGFHQCNEIDFPPSLIARKGTNPDAPRNDHYIVVSFNGKPTSVVPILYSNSESFDPNTPVMDQISFSLLVLEKNPANGEWKPADKEGRPVLLVLEQVEGFFEQVGLNTEYIIHPEEILADNFALIVTGESEVQSPDVLGRISSVLSNENETAEP